jgi:hypothetical protein
VPEKIWPCHAGLWTSCQKKSNRRSVGRASWSSCLVVFICRLQHSQHGEGGHLCFVSWWHIQNWQVSSNVEDMPRWNRSG